MRSNRLYPNIYLILVMTLALLSSSVSRTTVGLAARQTGGQTRPAPQALIGP